MALSRDFLHIFRCRTPWTLPIRVVGQLGQLHFGRVILRVLRWRHWFRSASPQNGTRSVRCHGNTLAHITNTAPNIDQGVEFHILPRVNTSRQWAVNQVYHPTSSYFTELQFALRHVATAVSHYLVLPGNPAGPYSQNINGTKVDCLPLCPTDIREVGAASMNLSAAAYVETDPTWQTTLNGYLESAYTNV